MSKIASMHAHPWHRVIVESERLLDLIQDPDGPAEVLEANAPASWSFIREAASALEDALAKAEDDEYPERLGLSRRDQFAMAAMRGILASDSENAWTNDGIAKGAVRMADALIAALDGDGAE